MNPYRLILGAISVIIIIFIAMISTSLFASFEPTDSEASKEIRMYWSYDGKRMSTEISVPHSDIEGYGNSFVPRAFCACSMIGFITPDDRTVRQIADHLISVTENMSDIERLHAVNSFINQTIEYRSDDSMHGIADYYQFPAETVVSGKGDCEDMALLEVSVLKAMGYDAAPLFTFGHCLVGVNIDGSGNSTDFFGKTYYHLDPTTGEPLGSSDDSDGLVMAVTEAYSVGTVIFLICMLIVSVYLFRRF